MDGPAQPSRLPRRARRLDGPGPRQAPNALSLHPLPARKPLGSIPSVPAAKDPSRRRRRDDELVDRMALLGTMSQRLFRPVAERQSCELKVLGLIPSGGLGDASHHRVRGEGRTRNSTRSAASRSSHCAMHPRDCIAQASWSRVGREGAARGKLRARVPGIEPGSQAREAPVILPHYARSRRH